MRLPLLPLLLLAAPSCAAGPGRDAASYSWVWILTGPRDAAVQGEERTAAFRGHFANMERLSGAGMLLVAGPMAEPRARADHRGIFVLGTADLAEARAAAATDPAAQAGIFLLEAEPFETAAPLRELPGRHAAFVAASGLAEPPPAFHCRAYVMATGAPAAAAEAALRGAPEVLLAGRFPARGAAHFWLDLQDAAAAGDFLRARGPEVEWTVIPWFGTEEIAALSPQRAASDSR